jgi:4-hydroxybenzoate polyprenyltransferase
MAAAVPLRSVPARAALPLLVPAAALLRTDPRVELVLAFVRRRPAALLGWLAHGRPEPLADLAAAVGLCLDPALLPLDPEIEAYLRAELAAGRTVAVVPGEDPALARALAARLGSGVEVTAEPGTEGPFALLAGPGATAALATAASSLVLAVDALSPAGASAPVEARIDRPRSGARPWARALRLHQWAKNLLVLVPLLLAGPLATAADLGHALLAFLAIGLLASAGYLVNDLLDLEADRRHPTKRARPLAAGTLPLRAGLAAVPLLLLAAALLAALLPVAFAPVAGAYLVLTLAYSLRLKRVPLLDVLILAGLFTIRVLAGAEVIAAPLSYWLLTFAMFLFLSLALVKRYAELGQLAAAGGRELVDRGYGTADLPLLLAAGLASGVAATVIFVVYLVAEQFPRAIYARPGWLWLVFPILLLWLLRTWRLALHGRMDQDPVLFALTDRPSLVMGAAVLACLLLAW